MKNKEEIIKEIKTLQLELNKIESLEHMYQDYVGRYFKFRIILDTKNHFVYLKVLNFWKSDGKSFSFKVLEIDNNSIFINIYTLEDLKTEITKQEFLLEYNKTLNNLNKLT